MTKKTQTGIFWCPHCSGPHTLDVVVCPQTGRSIERSLHKQAVREHPLVGTVIDGRYRILRVIGQGALGVVFEAENIALKRPVAIKIVLNTSRDEAAERLRRETEIVASLKHPNICDIYDSGWLSTHGPYMVTERLFGETLESARTRQRTMTVAAVVDIITQVLSGLHAAHAHNIVHRDLKPENIFLVDRLGCPPIVKVLDFGYAKDLSGANRTITRPGMLMGNAQYMSPEQLKGEPVTPRSDQFSVGGIAYHLLCGVAPFAGASALETATRILRENPTPIQSLRPEVSDGLAAVINRALAKDPLQRYADAAFFLKEARRHAPVADELDPASGTPSSNL